MSVSASAYGQWVTIVLVNSGSQEIKITNLQLPWGKLYADGDKNHELSTSQFNNAIIQPGDRIRFNSCGRENASSGTEGYFDVVDISAGGKKIRHFYWDCPWGSPRNTWTVSDNNAKWMVESSGANLDSGALGTITVEFLNKPGRKAGPKRV